MDRLQALLARKAKAIAAARKITADADNEGDGRELTEDESTEHATLIASIETINTDIEAETALRAAEAAMPILAVPLIVRSGAQIDGGLEVAASDPTHGFAHFGLFAAALINAALPGPAKVFDPRLRIGADVPGSDYAQEGVGADGGFLVPPEFSARIREFSLGEDALLPLTMNDIVGSNSMSFPVSEQTPWGTGGVNAYWEGEGAVANKDKPVLEHRTLRLKKLIGLVPVTDEILADAGVMSSYLPRELGKSIAWKVNDAIVNGAGTGQPNGFINGGSIVEQAAEGSQTADTININNVAKMYGRCLQATRGVWLINADSFNQIIVMQIGDQPAWIPPVRGITGAPNGTLMGLPLIISETCQTLGDAGDIYLCNLQDGYQTITKSGGVTFDTSVHLWFDYDMTAFRARFRMDGQSIFRNTVTPNNSTLNRSHFIRLAARA